MTFVSLPHLAAFVLAALVLGVLLGRWVWNEPCPYEDPSECEVCQKGQP